MAKIRKILRQSWDNPMKMLCNPMARNKYIKQFTGIFPVNSPGCGYMRRMYFPQKLIPLSCFMSWHQGCVNTSTTSIQRRARTMCEYILQKTIPQNYFLHSREGEYRPHMHSRFLKTFFPACIGFVRGGVICCGVQWFFRLPM